MTFLVDFPTKLAKLHLKKKTRLSKEHPVETFFLEKSTYYKLADLTAKNRFFFNLFDLFMGFFIYLNVPQRR